MSSRKTCLRYKGSGFSRGFIWPWHEGTSMHINAIGDCRQDEDVAQAWKHPEPKGEAQMHAFYCREGGWMRTWNQKLKAKFWGRHRGRKRENGCRDAKKRARVQALQGGDWRRKREGMEVRPMWLQGEGGPTSEETATWREVHKQITWTSSIRWGL